MDFGRSRLASGALSDQLHERAFGNRGVVPDVDTDVDHPFPYLPTLVDMTVKEPSALVDGTVRDEPVVVVTVTAVRKVAGNNMDSADIKLDGPLPDLVEARGEIALGGGVDALLVPVPTTVVVPCQQHLTAIEHTRDGERLVDAAHREVAKHDHLVVRRHGAVPTFDERVVHMTDIAKRPSAVVDDVAMAEVKIGGEVADHEPSLTARLPHRARDSGDGLLAEMDRHALVVVEHGDEFQSRAKSFDAHYGLELTLAPRS